MDHGVRFPASQELDDGGIDVSTEEGSCPSGVWGFGTDLVWGDAEFNPIGKCQMNAGMQHCSDVLSCDTVGFWWSGRITVAPT